MKPNIFTYVEYRAFLKDAFAAMQAKDQNLSYRAFAKSARFTSPNFLQKVIQGQRKLNTTQVHVVANAFQLRPSEVEFFQALVGFDQARSPDEKKFFHQKLLGNKRATAIKALEKNQYEYFRHWYAPVVRELSVHPEFDGSPKWIADRIYPRITVAEVESTQQLLLSLGLIVRHAETGCLSLADSVVASDSEASHLALREYHQSAIRLAGESIKAFPPEERDIRAVTLGVSRQTYADLKIRLEAFWNEIMESASDQKIEQVCQVNLQLFPLTRENKTEHE